MVFVRVLKDWYPTAELCYGGREEALMPYYDYYAMIMK